jgi:hypothetical protein
VYLSLDKTYKHNRALNAQVHKLGRCVRVRPLDEPDKLRPWVLVRKELGYREEGQKNTRQPCVLAGAKRGEDRR